MKTITKAPILFRGGDYNPDQWLDRPDILEKDVEMMKKAGMNTATLGVFAWAKYEPQEGEYDFAWLRETMDRLYAAGIYTELATPCGAKPNWMAKKISRDPARAGQRRDRPPGYAPQCLPQQPHLPREGPHHH